MPWREVTLQVRDMNLRGVQRRTCGGADLAVGAGDELAGGGADLAGLQSVLLVRKLALLGRRDVSAGGAGAVW